MSNEKQIIPNVQDAEAAAEKATAQAKEAAARVAELRAALAHAEAHSLDFADGETYAHEVAKLRFDLAKAADAANRAQAARDTAAKALQAARLAEAEQGLDGATDAANKVLGAFGTAAEAAAATLARAQAHVAETLRVRDEHRLTLRAAGHPPARDARTSMASAWPALLDKRPGAVGALATAVNVLAWLEAAPTRAAEEREWERRRDLERERAALAGHLGPEAKAQAEARRRAEVKKLSDTRGGGAFVGVRGSAAQREVETCANLAFNGKGE